jgi:flagellar biosynthesis protein FlhF
MRLKTYTAETMTRAMDLVRREMGDGAIIVATRSEANGKRVRVTAALEEDTDGGADRHPTVGAAPETSPAAAPNFDRALAFHRVPPALAERIVGTAASFERTEPIVALGGALDELFWFQPISERLQSRPIIVVGPAGAGKTVVCAKLLTRAHRARRPIAAVSADVQKAGGIEQLQAFTRILGVDLPTVGCPEELTEVAARAGSALLVIDTPGVNPFVASEMTRLDEMIAAADAEPVLVLAAGGDASESAEVAQAFAETRVRRIVCTRLDAARRFGSLLAAADAASLGFSEVGIGPHIADGLAPINPVSLARLLMPCEPDAAPAPPQKEAMP